MKEAVVMFSGGQDSTTVLSMAVDLYRVQNVLAVTADYGQRHSREIDAARVICASLGVDHEVVPMSGILAGTSPLTDKNAELETYESPEAMEQIIGDRREKTFVPMRNPLFFCVAANRAAVHSASRVYTGICQEDNANYDDCREVFRMAFQHMMDTALGSDHRPEVKPINLIAPLMYLSKAETVKMALKTTTGYEQLAFSHTAYSGEFPPVTQDHATVLRADGFRKANVPDPLILRAVWYSQLSMPEEPHYERFAETMRKAPTFREALVKIRAKCLQEIN